MLPSRHLSRYRQIAGILIEEGFGNALDVVGLSRFAPVRRLMRGAADTREALPVRLRHTLERLGPTFVKIGQVASTRPDLLPDPIIQELRKLQDEVTPFSWNDARAVVESELGGSIEDLFGSFEETPLASASLGQVYATTLPDGTPVAVKVQRPDARASVETDLDILLTQAHFVTSHSETGERYDIAGVAEEFANAVIGELDYLAEARNAERLREMFTGDDTVAFPVIYREFTTQRVLTMERFEGIPFNRPDQLDEQGMDRPELARRGIYAFLEMIFEFGFFHADPHPGNLFAMPDGRVAFTDFGRVGTISQIARDQLADLLLGIVENDTALAVDTLFAAAGYPGDMDLAELEREVSRLITKYANKTIGEVRIGDLVSDVFGIVRHHNLMMSSELAMLLTTLALLEGVGRTLDPGFDFVAVTAPFARRISNERWEPAAVARALTISLRRAGRAAAEIPESVIRLLRRAGQGEFRVAVHPTGFDPTLTRLEEVANRLAFALVVSAFVIGLSFMLARTGLPAGFVWVARVLWASAVGVGTWFFVSILVTHLRHPK